MSFKLNKDTYIISDNHFYHKNILKYEPVRTELINNSKQNTQEKLMKQLWNETVSNEDEIICLGDIYFGGVKEFKKFSILGELSGQKHLLMGNHDNLTITRYNEMGFNVVGKEGLILSESILKDQKMLKEISKIKKQHNDIKKRLFYFIIQDFGDKRVMFTHFPIKSNSDYDNKYQPIVDVLYKIFELTNCDYNIHGHTHSKNIEDKRIINVSAEIIGLKPIKISKLLK